MNERIRQLLALANGNRRVRILTLIDVERVLLRVPRRPGTFFTDSGGSVPGVYNYRSWTTVCVGVRRTDGRIALAIGVTGAQKGHVPRPDWLASEIRALVESEYLLEWADAATDTIAAEGGILLWEQPR